MSLSPTGLGPPTNGSLDRHLGHDASQDPSRTSEPTNPSSSYPSASFRPLHALAYLGNIFASASGGASYRDANGGDFVSPGPMMTLGFSVWIHDMLLCGCEWCRHANMPTCQHANPPSPPTQPPPCTGQDSDRSKEQRRTRARTHPINDCMPHR